MKRARWTVFLFLIFLIKGGRDLLNDKDKKILISTIKEAKHFIVLTGAGISTLSGIPDFRGKDGVYNKKYNGLNAEEILSLSYFYSHPDVFYSWCKDVWYNLDKYEPNIVHKVLTSLEEKGYLKAVYTQNIDMLHQRSGSKKVYELHGSPFYNHCTSCHECYPYEEIAKVVQDGKVPYCKKCGQLIKPDIILYEEALNSDVLSAAYRDFSSADLVFVLGSSLLVQPAASLPLYSLEHNAKIVIVNSSSTYLDDNAYLRFDDLKTVFDALAEEFES